MQPIIINADDYALSPGVSLGIRQLLHAKAINATSVMTNSLYWPKEALLLRPFKTSADIGLHLCLTDLSPHTVMPKLAQNGVLPSLKVLMKKAFLRQLPLEEIRLEFKAQLNDFIQRMQCFPAHLDGHQHIHCLPGIRQVVIDLYLEQLREQSPHTYIRHCGTQHWWSFVRDGLKAKIIHGLSISFSLMLKKHRIPHNNVFTGIYDFNKRNQLGYEVLFKRFWKEVTKEGGILMCHPGHVDEALKAQDPLTGPREAELQFFLSEGYKKLIADAGAPLCTHAQPHFFD